MGRRLQLVAAALLGSTGIVMWATTAHAPPATGGPQVKIASTGGGSSGAAVAGTAGTLAPLIARDTPHTEPELRLINILSDFRRGEIDDALGKAEQLIADKPNFRLAHLVYGDLLASRAGVPLSFQSLEAAEPLMAEARQRWKHYRIEKMNGYVPQPIVRLSDSQRHALVVDLEQSRLFVFENRDGAPVLVNDFYVSGGANGAHKQVQGDRKTPVGVYFVVNRLPGENLPDRYGPVAFPVDYPNEWDVRKGRTGGGIWLHGVASNTYSRPPLDSDGCVALSNEELEQIAPMLDIGATPVLIGERIDWIGTGQNETRREDIGSAIESWRSDWQSGNVDSYLSYYSDDFRGRGMDKRAWDKYKTRVTANKQFIRVEFDDMSIFAHPHEPDMMVVSFRQRYDSDNFSGEADKRQYWRAEADGRWRIISEETI